MGLFSSKKKSDPAPPPPVRRDKVQAALKLGMTWYGGDPDGDDFVTNRDRYYRALKGCTRAEVDYVEDALRRHGYPP
ncbi:hypothetical protein FH608_045955 [Nonomuraea phyllanthi]|uniref:Uncharacterized protein n=1 Tax=Nonomuraea phyllanthi TaxID=2219224 RepID=A0A5C4V652_9ACTN|nr:hypothetical protein [Nonomuraea phyllanthi]KAB8186842.1 hypothetical protein FH608_045955 [Nonomuraea phyllanthi]